MSSSRVKFDQVGPTRVPCDVQEVTDYVKAGFREDRICCGLWNPHQLPGTAGGVVVVARGVGRGDIEILGSVTGLMSRPSAEMCP